MQGRIDRDGAPPPLDLLPTRTSPCTMGAGHVRMHIATASVRNTPQRQQAAHAKPSLRKSPISCAVLPLCSAFQNERTATFASRQTSPSFCVLVSEYVCRKQPFFVLFSRFHRKSVVSCDATPPFEIDFRESSRAVPFQKAEPRVVVGRAASSQPSSPLDAGQWLSQPSRVPYLMIL